MIYLLSVMDNKKGIQKFQKKKYPFTFLKNLFLTVYPIYLLYVI
jgi:hypothetical protein